MKTSAAGRARIREREGEVLHTYYDSQGVLTGGVGHTGRMAPPKLTPGMTITKEMSAAWLAADLVPVETALEAVLEVPVTQNQFDALASFLFNVGVGWAGVGKDRSGKPHAVAGIFTRLNAGDIAGAAAGFDLFHKPPEIIKRRNSEKAQFLTPDAASVATRAAPSAATPIVEAALNLNAQPNRGPSPAPASATHATDSKGRSMSTAATADVRAKIPGVDFLQGAIDTVEGIIGSLTSGLVAAKDPRNPHVSSTPEGGGKFFGTIGNVQSAIGKLEEIVKDAKTKDVREGVADGVDLLTLAFATLDTWSITLPVVTEIFRGNFNLHAGGVDQPA